MSLLIFYLGYLFKEMYSSDKDSYASQSEVIDFSRLNNFKMDDFNFLSTIEMKLTRDIKYMHKLFKEHPDIDIYKDK